MQEFLDAIESGDTAKVASLLASDSSLAHARFKRDRTSLHVAAEGAHRAIARLLVEHGANVNAEDQRGFRPLHSAVSSPKVDLDLIRLLLASGANVDAQTKSKSTPLHLALSPGTGSIDAVNLLLESGANVNARSKNGWTALDHALFSEKPNLPLFELLIRHGANVNVKPESGQTGWLLCRAAAEGNPELVTLLIEAGAEINAVSEHRGTALHGAVRRGYDGVVKALLTAGADPTVRDDQGRTALDLTEAYVRTLAILEGEKRIPIRAQPSRQLINVVDSIRGKIRSLEDERKIAAALESGGPMGEFFRAIKAGNVDWLRDWLAEEADLTPPADDEAWKEWNPLRFAAEFGQREAAEVLIHYISFNAEDLVFALHVAAERGHSGVVDLLLSRGRDVNAPDKNGRTALQHAVQGDGGDEETVRVLLRAGANLEFRDSYEDRTVFQAAVGYANIAVVEAMIEFGADVNGSPAKEPHAWGEDPAEWPVLMEPWGARPLYIAVCSGSQPLVEMLPNAGARINDLSFGWSALHAAAALADEGMVELLLARGADRQVKSADNRTPADLLLGFRRSAELLRAATADPL